MNEVNERQVTISETEWHALLLAKGECVRLRKDVELLTRMLLDRGDTLTQILREMEAEVSAELAKEGRG